MQRSLFIICTILYFLATAILSLILACIFGWGAAVVLVSLTGDRQNWIIAGFAALVAWPVVWFAGMFLATHVQRRRRAKAEQSRGFPVHMDD